MPFLAIPKNRNCPFLLEPNWKHLPRATMPRAMVGCTEATKTKEVGFQNPTLSKTLAEAPIAVHQVPHRHRQQQPPIRTTINIIMGEEISPFRHPLLPASWPCLFPSVPLRPQRHPEKCWGNSNSRNWSRKDIPEVSTNLSLQPGGWESWRYFDNKEECHVNEVNLLLLLIRSLACSFSIDFRTCHVSERYPSNLFETVGKKCTAIFCRHWISNIYYWVLLSSVDQTLRLTQPHRNKSFLVWFQKPDNNEICQNQILQNLDCG